MNIFVARSENQAAASAKEEAYFERRRATWEALKDVPQIEELVADIPVTHFEVVDIDSGARAFVENADLIIVAGGFYGDETKGKFGNKIAQYVHFVVRASSGPNTGRTAYHGGKKFVFHGAPSALLENKLCFIGPETANDPISLMEEELLPLVREGFSYDNLAVGNFYTIMPYHRIMDVLGSADNSSTGVGMTPVHKSIKAKTCPRLDDLCNTTDRFKMFVAKDIENYDGFLAVYLAREVDKGTLWSASTPAEKNAAILTRLEQKRAENPRVVPEHVLRFAQVYHLEGKEQAINELTRMFQQAVLDPLFPRRVNVPFEIRALLRAGKKGMLEVTQGYCLANNVEWGHRYGTSADTTASGALSAAGVNPTSRVEVLNVLKFPDSSRVGKGNIPSAFTDQDRFSRVKIKKMSDLEGACTDFGAVQKAYFDAIQPNGILQPVFYEDSAGKYFIGDAMAITTARKRKEQGSTTGKPRITGLFDAVQAAALSEAQGPYAVLSCMDRGNDCDRVGMVVAYIVYLPPEANLLEDSHGKYIDCNGVKYHSGDIIRPRDPIPGQEVLERCQPIIKVFDGWRDTFLNCSTKSIPQNVARFVSAVQHYTSLKIIGLGTGPETDDIIFINRC